IVLAIIEIRSNNHAVCQNRLLPPVAIVLPQIALEQVNLAQIREGITHPREIYSSDRNLYFPGKARLVPLPVSGDIIMTSLAVGNSVDAAVSGRIVIDAIEVTVITVGGQGAGFMMIGIRAPHIGDRHVPD